MDCCSQFIIFLLLALFAQGAELLVFKILDERLLEFLKAMAVDGPVLPHKIQLLTTFTNVLFEL